MGGGMNVHPNGFVEAWALKREHIEKTFRWSPKTLTIIALAGVAFPLWVYKTGVREFEMNDKRQKKPAKSFL